MIIHTTLATEHLGELLLIAGDDGLRAIALSGQRHHPELPEESRADPEAAIMGAAREQLVAYAAGDLRTFDLPLAPRGTPFQLAVWEALRGIAYGRTTTYGALAAQIGVPGSARAVGHAVGRNPLGIVVPCHRVVGADGSLTGYAGGLERKRQLLALEGALRQPALPKLGLAV